MGEYFEITFFSAKALDIPLAQKTLMKALHIGSGRNAGGLSLFQLLENREVYFQVFDEPNYTEFQLSIMNLIFTRGNFDMQLKQILEVVSVCFDSVPSLLFATGIYELTDYYLEKVNDIQEFPELLFPKIPILFFRRDEKKYGYKATRVYRNVSCVVQNSKEIQDIFVEPT